MTIALELVKNLAQVTEEGSALWIPSSKRSFFSRSPEGNPRWLYSIQEVDKPSYRSEGGIGYVFQVVNVVTRVPSLVIEPVDAENDPELGEALAGLYKLAEERANEQPSKDLEAKMLKELFPVAG